MIVSLKRTLNYRVFPHLLWIPLIWVLCDSFSGGGLSVVFTSSLRAQAQPPGEGVQKPEGGAEDRSAQQGEADAMELAESMLYALTMGPPIQAKLRVRAWGGGKEVKEVGSYEQAGGGTGWMRMELEVPIADGKGRWQQTCDGRLAWTREELAGHVRVRRVDVGRVAELISPGAAGRVPWGLRVGGLAELIDRIMADYELTMIQGHLENVPMIVLKGPMREARHSQLQQLAGGAATGLIPQYIRVAIPVDRIELPFPSRIEFWTASSGKLLSMIEIYDLAPIEMPAIDRFRFEPGGDDFANETEAYLRRFGYEFAELTELENPIHHRR